MSTDAPEAALEQPAAPQAPEHPQDPEAPKPEETVTMTKAEVDALRRQYAEAERARKRLEAEQKKAEEARQAEQGEWQKLAEQRSQELEQERTERARVERERRVATIASRMQFIDPTDAIYRVSAEDGADDAATEAALERIAQSSPHLIRKEAPAAPEIGQVLTPSATPQGVQPPPGKAPLRTMAEIEALSDAEFNERYAEVQAVIRTQQ
jgi:hypothetical protein